MGVSNLEDSLILSDEDRNIMGLLIVGGIIILTSVQIVRLEQEIYQSGDKSGQITTLLLLATRSPILPRFKDFPNQG